MGRSEIGPRKYLKWCAPERDRVKVNCDASWCQQTNNCGIGEDSAGHVLGGAYRRLKCEDASSLEVDFVLLGVRLSIEKGCSQVVIASDSEVVINQQKGRGNLWRIETIC